MIDFQLRRILDVAPYELTLAEGSFIFVTTQGIHYRVSFGKEDIILGGCEVYQLILQRAELNAVGHDPKIESTVLAIIDEFFRSNSHVLLYICDTSDGKEDGRNRLFLRWFDRHAEPGRFTIRTAHAKVEEETIYAAIIVDNKNPQKDQIIADFDQEAALLTQKP